MTAGLLRIYSKAARRGSLPTLIAMRWLMIGLLVSLGALLLAAAGVARHIRLQHAKLRREPPASSGPGPDRGLDRGLHPARKSGVETKIGTVSR